MMDEFAIRDVVIAAIDARVQTPEGSAETVGEFLCSPILDALIAAGVLDFAAAAHTPPPPPEATDA